MEKNPVRLLTAQVARKIAAGEVIDRPSAIVRELMDNAVDSGANKISVEITGGGIEKIRVADNGCGMTKEDLATCAHPHATSKIQTETDLLNLTTLGFRGEALASMAAVSRLSIKSGPWCMNASVTEDHVITPITPVEGSIVQTEGLFENFPARRQFLKREASEGLLCRNIFEEKVLPCPHIHFSLKMEGEEKLTLPATTSLKERFCQTMEFFEDDSMFYETEGKSGDGSWSFKLVLGEPGVARSNRKNIFIYVNGRRIQEYSLLQAIEYGAQGYFPNGTHPVACLFVNMDPALVDFNIHPAKREARFKDIASLHHGVSSVTRDFYKKFTVQNLVNVAEEEDETKVPGFDFSESMVSATETTSYVKPFSEKPQYEKHDFSFSTKHSTQNKIYFGSSNQNKTSAQKLAAILSSEIGDLTSAENASVEGRVTKANYLPQEKDEDGFHFVGCALGTFLIAEKNDVLYIIDQHAAHERYLYNRIMEDAGQKQTLLVPYVIQTDSEADDNFLTELKDNLEECGYTCENKGNGKWEVTTVPIRWKGSEADLKKDLLDRRINPHDMINAVAASTACRSAVMDGDMLDRETAATIARHALELPDPHCPHGRPVYTTITRKQLFALVERV